MATKEGKFSLITARVTVTKAVNPAGQYKKEIVMDNLGTKLYAIGLLKHL